MALTAPSLSVAGPMADHSPALLWSIPRTQHELGDVSRPTVYDLLKRGELCSVKVRGRRMVVAASAFAFIARQQEAGG